MPELSIVPTNPTTNGKPSARKQKDKPAKKARERICLIEQMLQGIDAPFQKVWGCFVEDELGSAYLTEK